MRLLPIKPEWNHNTTSDLMVANQLAFEYFGKIDRVYHFIHGLFCYFGATLETASPSAEGALQTLSAKTKQAKAHI